MAKVLSSISRDSPSSPVSAGVNDTFEFAGTPSFSGGGGVQRYDFQWQVDSGGGYVTIGSSGTGLITAGTNPITNSNSQTQNAITVTCEQAGSYTIRMAGAPTSGGSYSVLSATQTVEVAAAADALTADSLASAVPTLGTPAIGQAHVLSATDLAASSPTLGTPVLAEDTGDAELTADDLALSGPTVGTPGISQEHVLTAGDLSGSVSIGSPAIGQVHVLSGTALTTTPALESPAIGSEGVDALEAMGIVIGSMSLGAPALSIPSAAKSPSFIPRARRSWRKRNDEYEKLLKFRRR